MNPFMELKEIEIGLDQHSRINDEDTKKRFKELLGLVASGEEYEDILKGQKLCSAAMISADEDADQAAGDELHRECEGVYAEASGVRNKYTVVR